MKKALLVLAGLALLNTVGPAAAQDPQFIVRTSDGTNYEVLTPDTCAEAAAGITEVVFDVELEDEALATFELQLTGAGLVVEGNAEPPTFTVTEIITSAAGSCR